MAVTTLNKSYSELLKYSYSNKNVSKDSFVHSGKNMKSGIKKAVIATVISLFAASVGLYFLAKKGKLGNKLKTFAENLFGRKKAANPAKAAEGVIPATETNAVNNRSGHVLTENVANPKSTVPTSPVSLTRQEILAQRRAAIDRLNQMDGVESKLSVSEDGKMKLGYLQEIDNAKDKMYDKLRSAKYPEIGCKNIEDFTDKETPLIRVIHNAQAGDWDCRIPRSLGEISEHSTERISLNVRPDENLIKKLDEYFVQHADTVRGYYKTPGYFEGWAKRHDPITIYLGKSAKGTTVLDDIAKIAEPYARESGTSVLIGKPVGNCCAHVRSPQISDYEMLRDRFIRIFGQENMHEIQPYGVRIGRNPRLSAGEFWAYNEVFNKISGENVRVLMP